MAAHVPPTGAGGGPAEGTAAPRQSPAPLLRLRLAGCPDAREQVLRAVGFRFDVGIAGRLRGAFPDTRLRLQRPASAVGALAFKDGLDPCGHDREQFVAVAVVDDVERERQVT